MKPAPVKSSVSIEQLDLRVGTILSVEQTLFVVNIEPRRMAGLTSEGMLLDLGFADGIAPALAIREHPIPNGARAG